MTSKPAAGAQIISLEIQFGSVEFNGNFEDFDPNGVLSVRAKILNYPTIEINENDFCDDCAARDETFSKGKHLLIPVPESKLKTLQEAFVINIKVMRTSLPEDLLPVMEAIGFTNVNIARTFANLLSKVDPATNRECPAVKLMSDQLEIIETDTGAIIGTINVYVRLKDFGKCIVTAMQDILGNKSQMYDKCFSSKDVVSDDDDDMCPPGVENTISMQNNEFKEVKAISPDLDLTVKINKPVVSDVNVHREVSKSKVRPGTIKMGRDNIVFNENQTDPNNQTDGNRNNVKYEMKTGRVQPADDQTLQMTPVPPRPPTSSQGPLTGQPVDATADVYVLAVTKSNAKKNVYASVQMEVRVPKSIKQIKERFTRDVQYLAADVAPPPAAGKKK